MTGPGPRPGGRLHSYGDGELHTEHDDDGVHAEFDVLSEDECEVTYPPDPVGVEALQRIADRIRKL